MYQVNENEKEKKNEKYLLLTVVTRLSFDQMRTGRRTVDEQVSCCNLHILPATSP